MFTEREDLAIITRSFSFGLHFQFYYSRLADVFDTNTSKELKTIPQNGSRAGGRVEGEPDGFTRH